MKTVFQSVKTGLGFATGVGVSTVFIANMNDILYFQFRMNVLLPFYRAKEDGNAAGFNEAAVGSARFANQTLRPLAVKPSNARELLLKDADYQTPQDNYFGYLQRMKS